MEKTKPIRLLILDVDGVLTNGLIYYDEAGKEMRGFHIRDGLGIRMLQRSGVTVAIISGKSSPSIEHRMQELKIEHVYLGQDKKVPAYLEIKQKLNLEDKQIAYMGDDLPDLPLLMRAGFAITVKGAPSLLHQYADYVTKTKAGKGAVREVCELIMDTQATLQKMLDNYLT